MVEKLQISHKVLYNQFCVAPQENRIYFFCSGYHPCNKTQKILMHISRRALMTRICIHVQQTKAEQLFFFALQGQFPLVLTTSSLSGLPIFSAIKCPLFVSPVYSHMRKDWAGSMCPMCMKIINVFLAGAKLAEREGTNSV